MPDSLLASPLISLCLFFWGSAYDPQLDNVSKSEVAGSDKAMVVHIRKKAHNELAIHTIRHSTMTWDRVSKILNLERSLKTGSKEPSKRCDERGESGEYQDVELDRRNSDGCESWSEEAEPERQGVVCR